ncbi:MAG: hypothetical protein NHF96_00095 [Candidatus Shikimatogenerans bostrichidophilus]|nr:MAG: hypothetical protein NHF96_00095 [Candidatus Shikimatogenerans bostrichidophilus]
MKIVIIKIKKNNIKKIKKKIIKLGYLPKISYKKKYILTSNKIIIHSNLNINFTINYLKKKNIYTILKLINKPILAISTGLHILCYKYLNKKCLNIFKNVLVKKILNINNHNEKNIGKKKIYHNNDDIILNGVNRNSFYQYFNHNDYINIGKYTIAHTNHILSYSAILKKKNIYGVQFFPEKSGVLGDKIIKNFIELVN